MGADDHVYVTLPDCNQIKRVSPQGKTSTMEMKRPTVISSDSKGNLYTTDMFTEQQYSHTVVRIAPGGHVYTFAGTGYPGYRDGFATHAQFSQPQGVTVTPDGNVYVADTFNRRIRRISPDGEVTTAAGNRVSGFLDGSATFAEFFSPRYLASDPAGNVYVADFDFIRKLSFNKREDNCKSDAIAKMMEKLDLGKSENKSQSNTNETTAGDDHKVQAQYLIYKNKTQNAYICNNRSSDMSGSNKPKRSLMFREAFD